VSERECGMRGRDGCSEIRGEECRSVSVGGRGNACGTILITLAMIEQGGYVRLRFVGC
jgi:hypothetical protein